jgi:predicted ribosomally synthesized peptide with SipW-like signal peptide
MPKKILLGLLTAGAVGGVTMLATNAFFSDTETSTGNILQAGAIDLLVDNTSYYNGVFNPNTSWLQPRNLTEELFFDFRDLKPGDYGEDTISLHVNNNDSWLCADVQLASDDDNGSLNQRVKMAIPLVVLDKANSPMQSSLSGGLMMGTMFLK